MQHAPKRIDFFVSFPFPTGWDTDVMVGTGAVTLGPELEALR